MNRTFALVLLVGALLAGGVTLQRTSAQNGTATPGQPTRANVWIRNRGGLEAVPVRIEDVASDSPLRVEVAGVPRVALEPGGVVQVRQARQAWEYRAVSVAAGQDPIPALNSAGADGWETTGVAVGSGGATVVLLKRPN